MSDKDDIKELFQRELGNYEAKVDPGLWQGVQSGISGSAASGASAGLSIAAKVAIGVVSAAAITVASVVIYNSTEENSKITENHQKEIASSQVADNVDGKTNDLKTNDSGHTNEGAVKENNAKKSTENDNHGEVQHQGDLNSSNFDNYENIDGNSVDSEVEKNTEEVVSDKDKSEYTDEKAEHLTQESEQTEKSEPKEEAPQNVALPSLILKPSVASQENQYVKFALQYKNLEEVVWDFGDGQISRDSEPEHFYSEGGNYEVTVTGRNGDREITEKLNIEVKVEGKFTKLPNIFSPNNDRNNDIFFVESEGIEEFQITIMDNEQKVVYQSNDVNFKWDGSLKTGVPAPEGDYVYMIVAKVKQGYAINKYKRLRLER